MVGHAPKNIWAAQIGPGGEEKVEEQKKKRKRKRRRNKKSQNWVSREGCGVDLGGIREGANYYQNIQH